MKKTAAIVSIILCIALLGGCIGTPVVYHADCDCPTAAPAATASPTAEPSAAPEGALKTGLALVTDVSGSASASADKNGEASYDATLVAVLVDDGGVIRACTIDGVAASVGFDASGAITSDLTASVKTKNELGADYGMVAWGGAVAEWDAQAAALASYAVGKTAAELRSGAIDESGYAPDGSDLASSATIYLGGYVSAIEKAAANAVHLGASGGDELRLAATIDLSSSASASSDGDGLAQLDLTATALTLSGGVITSCAIDSVQAKVNFDASGAVTSDLSATIKTKNELGADYGMVAWGGAIAEWDAQAAAFARYVVGKTAAEVAGITVSDSTRPTEPDLATSVTIAIGGFRALIEKAAQ